MSARRAPRRWLRLAGLSLLSACLVLGVLSSLGFVALNSDAGRARLISWINASLATQLRGKLEVLHIERIDLSGVHGVGATLADPEGRRVAQVEAAEVRASMAELGMQLLLQRRPFRIRVHTLSIEHAEARLVERAGRLTLQDALMTRAGGASSSPEAETASGFELSLANLQLKSALVTLESGLEARLSGLGASVNWTAAGLDIQVGACELQAYGVSELGTAQGELRGAFHLQPPTAHADARWLVQAQFEGSIAEVPISLSLEHDTRPSAPAPWSVLLTAPDVPASAVERWVPGFALGGPPLAIRASARGTLEDARIELDAALGEARLHAQGTAAVLPRAAAMLAVSAQAVDARALFAGAPSTWINLNAHLQLGSTVSGLRSRIELETKQSRLGDTPLPDTQWEAELGSEDMTGRVQVLLTDAPTQIQLELKPGSGSGLARLGFHVQTDVSAHSRTWKELPSLPPLTARGRLQAQGSLALSTGAPAIEAELWGSLDELAGSRLRARGLALRGSARGPLTAPRLKLFGRAQTLAGWGHELRAVSAAAHGEVGALRWRLDVPEGSAHIPELHATGRLDAPARRISQLELVAKRSGVVMHATSRALELSKHGFRISGVELQGAGRLAAELRAQGGQLRLRAKASELDLEALATLAGVSEWRLEGLASFDVELHSAGGKPGGKLQAQLQRLAFRGIRAGTLNADLQLEEGLLGGKLTARAGESAELALRATALRLPRVWSRAELLRGRGRLELESSVELAHLQRLGLDSMLPFAPAAGHLTLQVMLSQDPGALARSTAKLRTQGLAWHPLPERDAVARRWPGIWQGVDLDLTATLEHSELSLALELIDAQGTLVHISSRWPELRFDSLRSFDITRLPCLLELELPRRSLANLPPALRPPAVDGQLHAELKLRGSLAAPTLTGSLDLSELELAEKSTAALQIQAKAAWANGLADLSILARAGGATVLDAHAHAPLSLAAVLAGRQKLDAALSARIAQFPLHALAFLGDPSLDGSMDGQVELSGIGGRPEGDVQLRLSRLTLGDFAGQRLSVDAAAQGGRLRARLDLEQPGGRLQASVEAGLIWHALGLPQINAAQGMQGELSADGVRLVMLRPFLPPAQRGFDGVFTGHLLLDTALHEPLTGQASVRDGVLLVPALGQEFRDVRAELELAPGGRARLTNAAARAVSGQIQLHGEGELKGVALQRGTLTITVNRRQRVPVTVQGVAVGTAWGEVMLTAARVGSGIELSSSVPTLHVELPSIAPRAVQQLDADPTIATGIFIAGGRFVPYDVANKRHQEPRNPAADALHVRVELGKDVWIHRGGTLQVRLTGALDATLADQPRLAGTLSLPEGEVDVQGRLFDVQDSTITFQANEDPANPILIGTARWLAPDGYEVYAEFVGPLETGKLSLRSEPPLDDNGILSLLLFGSPDGLFGASASAEGRLGAATAVSAGGGVLTMGLNRQLQELTSLDIRTRIDQSGGRAHPEIALQLSPRVTAELAYDLATPSPGESPDTTFLTLDMRLLRNWSLSTTVGNQGSTFIDMFWRYRY
jgi:translocation and assembly module TamB